MTNLNMWQRICVVLSVLWLLGAGAWQRSSDVARASSFMTMSYQTCTEVAENEANIPPPPDGSGIVTVPPKGFHLDSAPDTSRATTSAHKCMDQAQAEFRTFLVGSWENVLFMAIVPIIGGWLLALLIICVVRWIATGKR